jgi:hypothetical protein
MGRVIEADEIMLKDTTSEVKKMVADNQLDYIRCSIDSLLAKLVNGGSEAYDDTAINRLGNFLILLPDTLAFAFLKDVSTEMDMCERLILKRDDIFAILKRVRMGR